MDAKSKNAKRLRLPKRTFLNPPAFFKDVEFRAVRSVDEWLLASRLVYKEYLSCGYIPDRESRLHFSLHETLPTTVKFVAVYRQSTVLGTVTLVEDGELGVPMEKIYRDELNNLRRQRRSFAEIGMLALDEETLGKDAFAMTRSQRLFFLFHLYKAMFDHFRNQRHLDQLVACFHPKHDFMYRFLGFQPLGGLQSYDAVQGNPAVARYLNKKEHEIQALVDQQFQDMNFYYELSPRSAVALRLSAIDLRRLFVESSDVLSGAGPKELATIKKFYPSYDFDEILTPAPKWAPSDKGRKRKLSSPLMDVIVETAGRARPMAGALDLNETELLRASFESRGFSSGDFLAVIVAPTREREWRLCVEAARVAGGRAVGLSTDMTVDQIRNIFAHFPPAALVVERCEQMALIPEESLDRIKFIIVLEERRGSDELVAYVNVLFSPPVSKAGSIINWADLYETPLTSVAAHVRSLRLKRGDRLAMLVPNGSLASEIKRSAFQTVDVVVTLDPAWPPGEINNVLGMADANCLVVQDQNHLEKIPLEWRSRLKRVAVLERTDVKETTPS